MKLSAPKNITLLIAVILAIVGALGAFGVLTVISVTVGTVILLAAFILLALSVMLKGL